MTMLLPNAGKGKEIADYLREVLNIPAQVRWFDVRFAVGEPVTVRCEFYPEEQQEEPEPDEADRPDDPDYGGLNG